MLKRGGALFRRTLLLSKTMVTLASCLFTLAAYSNPVLDHVANGNVAITQSPNSTVINQSSQQAIINWQSFNIGQQETTHFQQPAGGVALNRINPTQGPSSVYGRLTATGQIILSNPAGIYFGPTAYVNVGGMVATTMDVSDHDFLNGIYRFNAVPNMNGAVINQGTIIAADHGLVALVGGAVSNEGSIQANLGHVVLASGSAMTMSFAGNELISFTVDQPTAHASVVNTGTIQADGGQILISAKGAANVLDQVINLQGVIQARSVAGHAGEIIIAGDDSAGVVRIAGVISVVGDETSTVGGSIRISGHDIVVASNAVVTANSPVPSGSVHIGSPLIDTVLPSANTLTIESGAVLSAENGFIETSAKEQLNIGNAEIRTATWLIDPYDLTIGGVDTNINGGSPFEPSSDSSFLSSTTLYNALAVGDVIVQTGEGGTGNGDITIATALSYASPYTLLLSAYRNIVSNNVNNEVINNAGTGNVILRTDNTGTGVGTVQFTGTSPTVTATGGVSVYYNPVIFGNQDNLFASGAGTATTQYMLINALGLANDIPTARTLGALSSGFNAILWLPGKNYALAKDIDATATLAWNSGSGFRPIGNYNFTLGGTVVSNGVAFSGKFDGQGYKVSNLYINQPDLQTIGMFGRLASTAQVTNLILPNLTINYDSTNAANTAILTASRYIGSLAGYVDSGAVISQVYVNGSITQNGEGSDAVIGGLVGQSAGNISLAESDVYISAFNNASANHYTIGGVIGQATGGAITNVSATNNILVDGNIATADLGGLIGNNAGTVSKSFSVGAIVSEVGNMGGLIATNSGTVSDSYWNTQTSGLSSSAGGAGLTTAQMQNSANFINFDFTNDWNIIAGISFPYHRFAHVATPRVISGTLASSADTNSSINILANGNYDKTIHSYANDTFYLLDTSIADSSSLMFYLHNANIVSNFIAFAPNSNGHINDVNLSQDTLTVGGSGVFTHAVIAAAKGSIANSEILYSVSSNDLVMNSGKSFAVLADSDYHPEGNLSTTSGGSINIAGALDFISNFIVTVSGDSLISGVISNAATKSLIKAGVGELSLTNPNNNFIGNIIVNAGSLIVTSDGALGGSANDIYLNNGSLASSGNVTLNPSRTIMLNSGSNSIESGSGTLTVAGLIDGANDLILFGFGSIILTGAVGSISPLSTLTSSVTNLTLNNNITTTGNQSYSNTVSLANHISLTGASIDLDVLSGNGFDLTISNSAISNITGTISGSGTSINKLGVGALVLSGTNNYTGGTSVISGSLVISDDANLGDVSSSLTINGGSLYTDFMLALSSSRSLIVGTNDGSINTNSGVLTVNSIISGSGNLTKLGAGTLLLNASNTYSGDTYLSAGQLSLGNNNALNTGNLVFTNGGSGTLTFSGNRTIANNIIFTGSGTIDQNNTITTLSGALSGTGGLVVNNTGGNDQSATYINLTHANTGLSGTVRLNAGTIGISNDNALGSAILTIYGGNLHGFGGTRTLTNTINANGGFIIGRDINLNGNFILNANTTIYAHNYDGAANSVSTIGGDISEIGGPRSLTIATIGNGFGTGSFVLSGNNSYTGGTVIDTGAVLTIANASSISTGQVATNGTLNIQNNINITNPMVVSGTINSSGNNSLSGSISSSGSGIISNNAGSLTINGLINGVSSGSGDLTLAGAITLNNSIGSTNALNSLLFSGNVLLATDIAITANNTIGFSGTINSQGLNRSLTINNNGTTTFSANIGNSLALSSLTTDVGGITAFGASVNAIQTSGAQNYHDAVTLANSVTFSSADILFDGSVSAGSNAIILNGSGTAYLNADLTAVALTSNKTLTVLGANISTTGAQSYPNAVTLGLDNDAVLTGDTITFSSPLSWVSARQLTVQPSTTVVFNQAISAPNGTLNINAPNAGGAVSLTANSAVDVYNFILMQGQWNQNTASLPVFNVRNNFQLGDGTPLTEDYLQFLRVSGGTGVDVGNSYLINDIYGLQGIGSNSSMLNSFYKLANDIDATITRNWNNGSGFIPIGSYSGSDSDHSGRFSGTIDGLVNAVGNITAVIKNLYINRSDESYVGFIAAADDGTIKNTALINSVIAGYDQVGGLVGRAFYNAPNSGLNIQNVYVTGTVSGHQDVGGLVGRFESGVIQTSYNDADVYGVNSVGGIVGHMQNGAPLDSVMISNVYNIGDVTGVQNVGGLVGWGLRTNNTGISKVEYSYSNGYVIGESNVGGLLGGGDNNYPMTFDTVYWESINSQLPSATGGVSISAVNVNPYSTYENAFPFPFSGFDVTINPTTSASTIWFAINGYTLPLLMMEHSTHIRNAHQFQLMNADTSANYVLLNDIDMSGTYSTKDVWKPSIDWVVQSDYIFGGSKGGLYPIGNRNSPFTGSFDGNNYNVNNLNMASNDEYQDHGLFGNTNAATIQNVNIINPLIYHFSFGTNDNSNGVLVGHAIDTDIHNINIINAKQVYALVDYFAGSYQPYNGYYGGVVGQLEGGSINNVFVNTLMTTIDPLQDYRYQISGWIPHDINAKAGGLVGFNNGGTISEAAAGGTLYFVSGTNDRIGGFVGLNATTGTIIDSYSYTSIIMSSFNNLDSASIGGFVGENLGSINRTYATGLLLPNRVPSYGGFTALNSGSISNSFWDVNTTGISTSAAAVGKTTAELLSFDTYSSWSTAITSTASSSAVKPTATWFVFDDNTRPMLLSAWTTDISTPYQLQLMGTTLGASYTLNNNIDLFNEMRDSGNVWATDLNDGKGRGFVPIGYSTITSADSITNTASSNDFVGQFDGQGYLIKNLYINKPINIHTVGLFGQVSGNANIANLSVIDANVFGTSTTGILAGNVVGSGNKSFDNLYVSGSVSSNQFSGSYLGLGGMFGRISLTGSGSGNISNIYSTAYVYNNGQLTAGGLIGQMEAANSASVNLSNSYSSGRVTGSVGVGQNAGLIGVIGNHATITNSLWDTVTSNQAYAYQSIGSDSSVSNLLGGCFGATSGCSIQPLNASNTTAVDLSLFATYVAAGWSADINTSGSITATPVSGSSVPPNYTWFMVDGFTRPMLLSEWSTTINTAHQLQLMAAVLGADYQLASNINFNNLLANPGEVWSTNQSTNINYGFTPIGTNSFSNNVLGSEFTGTFDGQGKSIQNLYINRPDATTSVGLFGAVANRVIIKSLSLTDATINGGSVTGGLIGNVVADRDYARLLIDNIYVSGTVSANNATSYSGVGGLIGRLDIAANDITGGKLIQNSYTTATVASDGGHNAGGMIGYLSSPGAYIQYAYSTGLVSASGANVGGFVGVLNQGGVRRSLWDTVTSNQANGYGTIGSGSISNFIGGCFGDTASCAIQPLHASNTTAADLSLLSTYQTTAAWSSQARSITGTPSISFLKPEFTWFILSDHLRPMLLSEWSSEVSTTHQVQLMAAAQKGIYFLQNYIDFNGDMNNAAEVWATNKSAHIGSGFFYIGTPPIVCYGCGFAGFLDGQQYTIDNLYMNVVQNFYDTGVEPINAAIAFISNVFHDPLVQNITLANVDFNVEHIASLADESLYYFGVLFGDVNSRGAVIRNSYTTGKISSYTNANFALSGGFIGKNFGGTIYNSGSSVDVLLNGINNFGYYDVGGFAGNMQNISVVYNSYSTGSVSLIGVSNGISGAGGFAGQADSGFIYNSYSTGKVSGIAPQKGGFIGFCPGNCVDNNNFWDIESSGILTSGAATGKTTQQMMSLSTFSNWDITATPSETADTPNSIWFIFDGSTRPMLMSEWSASIATPHQLQMMGVALDANYTLANDINLSAAMNDPRDVWGSEQQISTGKGFVPIASSDIPFTGSLNGQGYTINDLYINRSQSVIDVPTPTTIGIGLFSAIGEPAIIQNLGLTNVDIRYASTTNHVSVSAGSLVGIIGSESIARNVFADGGISVFGNFNTARVGGITGSNYGVIINANSGMDLTVTGSPSATTMITGGLVGTNFGSTGSITNAYSTGTVIANGNATTIYTGGFAGENQSTISLSYSSGKVISIDGDVGGFLGHDSSGTINASLWDQDSSGLDTSAGGAGVLGKSTAELKQIATFIDAGWISITNDPSQSPTKPASDWFIFENGTRPILLSEWSRSISTSHQLQLMGAATAANYTLNNTINMQSAMNDAADVWATNSVNQVGNGFVPIGMDGVPFNGSLAGDRYSILNLYMNSGEENIGLFGVLANGSMIRNLTIADANYTYTNTLTQPDAYVGILAAKAQGGAVIQNVAVTGSLVVNPGFTNIYAGGLVGMSSATILNAFSAANVDVVASSADGIYIGGMVGQAPSGSITNSYSIGHVSASGMVTNEYIGGLLGHNSAIVSQTYSSGMVDVDGSATNQFVGGLAGLSTTNINASYWDATTSGQSTSAGGAGVVGKMTSELLDANTYAGWNIATTPSSTTALPDTTWFIFQNNTRPMLLSEWSQSISTPHQLQLMGAVLGINYKLANDIDLSASMNNAADVWASNQANNGGKGFLPIGRSGTNAGFTADFDGHNYIVNNLYINRPTEDYIGLFGITTPNYKQEIKNIGLTNVAITGRNYVSGLVGNVRNYSIENVFITGSINATSNFAGGIAGLFVYSLLDSVYNGANITSQAAYVGGITGVSDVSVINNAYNTGSISGTTYVGGLVGYNVSANINYSYSSGHVTGIEAGGFIGSDGGSHTYTGNFFDSAGSQNLTGAYNSSRTGITGGCVGGSGCLGGFTTDLSSAGTYVNAGWSISSTPSSTAHKPAGTWYIFDKSTRPMLSIEWNTNISTPHQLQMMGTTLGANYQLTKSFNIASLMNVAYSQSEVWGTNVTSGIGKGFVPIGSAAQPFTGIFEGNHFEIDNLYIKRTNETNIKEVGLFGAIAMPAIISNISLNNVNINYNAGVITTAHIGTLVGYAGDSTTFDNTVVNGQLNISNTSSGATLNVGGIVGTLAGNMNAFYSDIPITITATNNLTVNAGGLIGHLLANGQLSESYTIGQLNASGITNVNAKLGGLVGVNDGQLTNNYSLRNVTLSGSGVVGGLTGGGSGSATASFWDTGTTGIATSAQGGDKSTQEMFDRSTYTGWDFVNTWNSANGQSYPFFRKLYSDMPRFVSGSSTAGNNAQINLVADGQLVGSVNTGASGFYYFLLPYGTVADGANLLAYIDNNSTKANAVGVAPVSGGSLSGIVGNVNVGLNMTANTVTVGGSGVVNNAVLGEAKGSYSDSDILFSYNSGNNTISIGGAGTSVSNANFTTSSSITYQLSGDISLLGAGATIANFNSDLLISGNRTISGSNYATLNFYKPFNLATPLTLTAGNSNFLDTLGVDNTSLQVNGDLSVTGAMALTNNAELAISNTSSALFNGATNIDNSSITLDGDTTFAALNLTNAAALTLNGSSEFNGIVDVSNATLTLNNASEFNHSLSLSSGAIISLITSNSTDINGETNISGVNSHLLATNDVNFNNTVSLTSGGHLTIFADAIFNDAVTATGDSVISITGSGLYEQPIYLTGSSLMIGGNGTFNNLLSLTSDSYISIEGATAVNHSLIYDSSTASLGGDVSFSVPIDIDNSTLTVHGSSIFNNTVNLADATISFIGNAIFNDSLTLSNSILSFYNNATFNDEVILSGAVDYLSGLNASSNTFTFNAPVYNSASVFTLYTNGSTANNVIFNNVVHNSGGILVSGDRFAARNYTFNAPLNLLSDLNILVDAQGVKTFNFSNGVTGNKNLTVTGIGGGSYKLYLAGDFALNSFNVSLPSYSKGNLFDVESENMLRFDIFGTNKTLMTGMNGITLPVYLNNVDNIVGGSNSNSFVFAQSGRITGVLDGRSRDDNNILNSLDFTKLLTQLDVTFASTSRISLGTVSNRVLGLITNFRAINDIVHSPAVSNGKITLPKSVNNIVITAANGGYINNPIQFSNFQQFVSTGGQDSVYFQSFSLINPVTGQSIMPNATMSFTGFGQDSFSGNIITTNASLDAINSDAVKYGNVNANNEFSTMTDDERSNIEELIKQQAEIIDNLLKETKIGTGAQCGT